MFSLLQSPVLLLLSQDGTPLLPFVVLLFTYECQCFFGSLPEYFLHIFLILCRTLQVELCVHLLPSVLALQTCRHYRRRTVVMLNGVVRSYLNVSDGGLVCSLKLPYAFFILSEVSLATNQNDRSVPTEVSHFWEPLARKELIIWCSG